MIKKIFLLLFSSCTLASCVPHYPVRIGRDDVKEYSISDFGDGRNHQVKIEYNHGIWRRSQSVMVQGGPNIHAIASFLNEGEERKKFLAGFNVIEADIDSVRIFFPGEMNFKGEIYDCGRLEIYLKRYVRDLCSNHSIDREN